MGSFVATEIAKYYSNNKSDVYMLLLDASKAFDTVEYVKLFKILRTRGLCPLVTKLLLGLYTKQLLCVKWANCISEYCTVDFNLVPMVVMLAMSMFWGPWLCS